MIHENFGKCLAIFGKFWKTSEMAQNCFNPFTPGGIGPQSPVVPRANYNIVALLQYFQLKTKTLML